jgi:hypothetical protein
MENEKEVALYYPHIDIDDAGLIKTAALYWDELQTIVPESVHTPYQAVVSKEACDAGFLKARIVHSEDDSVRKTGDEFCKDIEQEPVKQRVISTIHKIKRKGFSRIHFDKWAYDYLFRVWLAVKDEIPLSLIGDDYNYVAFPAPLGHSYMSRLASVIAQHDKSVPLTNLPAFQDILIDRYIDYEAYTGSTHTDLAKLTLQTISINQKVPLKNVLQFRDKHRKELLRFRRQLRKLTEHISGGLDTSAKQKLLKGIISEDILPRRDEIEAKLSESNVTYTISAIGIAIPTILGIVTGGGLAIFAGGVVSLSSALTCSLYSDRQYIKGHPFGYLYSAQKKFGQKR